MNAYGFNTFGEKLRGLCDAYGRKPPGESGMGIWWETLKQLHDADVLDALAEWTRTQPKAPTPADIYKLANNRGIDRREQTWEQTKNEEKAVWSGPTPFGNAAIALIREMTKTTQRPGPWWAYKILKRHAAGEDVGYYPLKLAREVAEQYPEYPREPGEDLEEQETPA